MTDLFNIQNGIQMNDLFNIQMTCILYNKYYIHWFWNCYTSIDSAGYVSLDVVSNVFLNVEQNHL